MSKSYKCCNIDLDFESSGNRDTETMGGFSVEYLRCSICKQGYELILDSLDGDSLCINDSKAEDYENY